MNKNFKLFLLFLPLFLIGCATTTPTPKAVLLPDDRIFMIKANTEIDNLLMDNKPLGKMVFPQNMYLVSSEVLVKQAQQLNDAKTKQLTSDKQKNQVLGIFGSFFAVLAAALGIYFKVLPWIKTLPTVPKK